jgi:hypothetical protein
VHCLEALLAPLEQHTDEVNRRFGAIEGGADCGLVLQRRTQWGNLPDVAQRLEKGCARRPPNGDPHDPTLLRQALYDVAPEESRTTEYGDDPRCHAPHLLASCAPSWLGTAVPPIASPPKGFKAVYTPVHQLKGTPNRPPTPDRSSLPAREGKSRSSSSSGLTFCPPWLYLGIANESMCGVKSPGRVQFVPPAVSTS